MCTFMHSLSQHLRNVITYAPTAEKLSPSTVSLPPPSLPLSLSLSLNTPNPPPWQLYYAQIYQYRYLPTPRVVLPDRALCIPTFCHSLQAVNKTSSSSSPTSPLSRQAESTNLTTNTPEAESCPRGASAGGGSVSRSTSWQRHSVQQRPSSSPRPTPASSTRAARSCTGDSTVFVFFECVGVFSVRCAAESVCMWAAERVFHIRVLHMRDKRKHNPCNPC